MVTRAATGGERASRTIAYAETLAGIGAVILLGLAVPQWELLELEPHPLWFVMIIAAVRYGAPTGYLAASLAALTYVSLVWLEPATRFEPIPTPELVQAFLLFLTGVLISEVVSVRDRRIEGLEADLEQASEDVQRLNERYDEAVAIRGELQKRVVDKAASMEALHELVREFTTAGGPALLRTIIDVLRRELDADACALYLCGPDGRLQFSTGQPEIYPMRARHPEASDLVHQAVEDRAVVTLRDRLVDPEGRSLQEGSVMMAGPILSPQGEVLGAAAIESLPLLKLTPSNARLLGLILDLAGDALARARDLHQPAGPGRFGGNGYPALEFPGGPRAEQLTLTGTEGLGDR